MKAYFLYDFTTFPPSLNMKIEHEILILVAFKTLKIILCDIFVIKYSGNSI